MAEESRGQRFYLVRLACGDGFRAPEPLRQFCERVLARTGIRLHASELSEIENDKPSKAVTLEHAEAVASVDPKRRGKLWLAWGESQDATMGDVPLARNVPVSKRAVETIRRGQAAAKPAKKAAGQRRPRRPQD
jgi:hypothetical protein